MSIVKVFGDIDMRLQITGLNNYLTEHKIKLTNNDMAMFLNKKRTAVKVIWNKEFLLHLRKDSGKIELNDLKLIPQYFTGVFINSQMEVRIGNLISNTSLVKKDKAA